MRERTRRRDQRKGREGVSLGGWGEGGICGGTETGGNHGILCYVQCFMRSMQLLLLYNGTVPASVASSPLPSNVPLTALVGPENATRHSQQVREIQQAQCFCLEYALQGWEVDNHHLANQRPSDGIVEHFVVEDADFACEHGFAGRATC